MNRQFNLVTAWCNEARLEMSGGVPPHFSSPQNKGGGGEKHNLTKIARKRAEVTSATTPLAIEGVKDGYSKANLVCRSIKIEG